MSDTQAKIGKLVTADEGRDAIHIAVVPLIAAEDLEPGTRVRTSNWHWDTPPVVKGYATDGDAADGIVDPFLTETVKEGERFWLFLLPNTITGLRHDWSHPSFPTDKPKGADAEVSEKWLRDYADRYRADYDRMIEGSVSRQGYCFGDDDGPPSYTSAGAEFWHHIEVVTGRKFSDEHRENTPFRCAC